MFQAKLVFLLNKFHTGGKGTYLQFVPTRIDFEVQRYFRGTSADAEVRYRQYSLYGEEGLQAWVFRGGFIFSY